MTALAMPSDRTASPGAIPLWTGRVLSGLVILFFVMDGLIKLPPLAPVTETLGALGWPTDAGTARALGLLLLACAGLYAWRPTAILGAILATAYLGGAVATHARIGSPLASHTLFGVYVGVLMWGGLVLREPRLKALLPFSRA